MGFQHRLDTTLLDMLEPYATHRQLEYIKAIRSTGSQRAAARLLKTTSSTISASLHRLHRKAARQSPDLHTYAAPAGYVLKGTSTLLGADGSVKQQWIKTTADTVDSQEVLAQFRQTLQDSPVPAAKAIAKPKGLSSDLLTVYPMGDPHLGMHCWGLETGQPFDLKRATANLYAAVDNLVHLAPASEKALIVNLGDFFHSDSQDNRTARGGHSLDVDSRWSKVLRAGIGTMVRCIDRAREKHRGVRVINEIGNHDDHSAMMLSICLEHHYRNDPRVEIDVSPAMCHWYEFGSNLIGVHHGHTIKWNNLPGVMSCDQADAWGRTTYRYWYTGHVHHERKKEFPGCIVGTFRTLAARDAWHAGQGYRAGRSMVCTVLHKTRGEILRHTVGVEEL